MQEEYSSICPDYRLYTCDNMMAMEDDVLELFVGFIRATKPKKVVELGAYEGGTTKAIGEALQRNGVGECTSYEIDPHLSSVARCTCTGLPVDVITDNYNYHIASHTDIDILLVDGDNATGARYRDFYLWYPAVRPRGLIFIHDALKGPDEYKETQELELGTHCRLVLWTPRGMSIMQKGNF